MKRFTSKKGITLLAVMVVAVVSAVGAYAYWTTGGTGSGSATAGTNLNVVVNQDSVSAANLYPGGPAEALSGDFDNPNPGNAYVSSVTAVVSSVTGGAQDAAKPACAPSDFLISGTSNVPGDIPSGVDKGAWSGLNIALLNTAANQDNCKNATAVITYTANAL